MENEHIIVNDEERVEEAATPSSSKRVWYILLPLVLLILGIGALSLLGRNRTPNTQTTTAPPITSTQEVLQDSDEDEGIFFEEPTATIGIVSPTTTNGTLTISPTKTPTPKVSPTITLGLQANPTTSNPSPTSPAFSN